jgi:hypothetical protein
MKNLQPNNYRVSNSLFESIQNAIIGKTEPVAEADNAGAAVDKAHFCATHVEHALLGPGTCISEQHAEPDENGNIAWYSVQFPSGIQRVDSSNLKIVEGKHHTHGKKMAEETVDEALVGNQHKIDELSKDTLKKYTDRAVDSAREMPGTGSNAENSKKTKRHQGIGKAVDRLIKLEQIDAHDFQLLRGKKKPVEEANDGNLANNAKPYNKVTHGDVISGRLGKDEMGGKKKVKESNELDEESLGDAAGLRKKADEIPKHDTELASHYKTAAKHIESGNVKALKRHLDGAAPYTSDKSINTHNEILQHVDKKHLPSLGFSHKANVKEASAPKRSAGSVFDKDVAAQYMKSAPGEKAGFTSKKISTGTVYNKKLEKEKPIKEGLTQTVINYNDFTLEVTDNPTYGDYLTALQSMINTTNEDYQQTIVTIAEEAFNEKVESIIVEAKTRATFKAKLTELRSQKGVKVLDEEYGVDADQAYVEYTVEKDGALTQYVHIGTVEKK